MSKHREIAEIVLDNVHELADNNSDIPMCAKVQSFLSSKIFISITAIILLVGAAIGVIFGVMPVQTSSFSSDEFMSDDNSSAIIKYSSSIIPQYSSSVIPEKSSSVIPEKSSIYASSSSLIKPASASASASTPTASPSTSQLPYPQYNSTFTKIKNFIYKYITVFKKSSINMNAIIANSSSDMDDSNLSSYDDSSIPPAESAGGMLVPFEFLTKILVKLRTTSEESSDTSKSSTIISSSQVSPSQSSPSHVSPSQISPSQLSSENSSSDIPPPTSSSKMNIPFEFIFNLF